MKTRTDASVLIAKAIVWVAGRALESIPVVGPIFRVVNFVNDIAELKKDSAGRDSSWGVESADLDAGSWNTA